MQPEIFLEIGNIHFLFILLEKRWKCWIYLASLKPNRYFDPLV